MYKRIRWSAAGTSAPVLQPLDCFISSHQCVCVYKKIHTVYVHVCIWTCLRVYTKERKGFSIASCPTRLPRRSWGGGQRHYSAIKLLFAGVTLSGGCVDRGGNALKVYSHIYTHISFRQGCLRSGLLAVAPRLDGA